MVVSGYGYGKTILFGEHFVVYGVKAIASALSLKTTVYVEHYNEDAVEGDIKNEEILLQAINKAKELLGIEEKIKVRVECDFPPGMGMGGSASFSVALIRALAQVKGESLDEAEVSSFAYELEKLFHGKPSGIDNTVSAFGGIITFRRGKEKNEIERLEISERIPLLIVNTGKVGDTKHLVMNVVKPLKERNENIFSKLMEAEEKIVEKAVDALKNGNVTTLGELMNINQGLLNAIGVSTKEIEEICFIARENKAYGAKLTGAGGGGNVVVIGEKNILEEIKKILDNKGYTSFMTEIG